MNPYVLVALIVSLAIMDVIYYIVFSAFIKIENGNCARELSNGSSRRYLKVAFGIVRFFGSLPSSPMMLSQASI